MEPHSNHDLLRRYAATRDADAFSQLVRRHIGMVHAAARRQVRDAHLAEDVTQAVFIVLARRAGTIRSDAALAGWLFSVTRHAAQNAMKTQSRRQFHERRAAAERNEQIEAPDTDDSDLRHVLDEAVARLPRLERTGVVLHYFQDRTHEQVGAALGLSAEAARKRVTRAVERMRLFLSGRGVTAAGTAIAAGLRADAFAAVPPQLVSSTINVAMLSTSASAGVASLAIAHGVTRMFALAQLKIAAGVALAIGTVAAVAVPVVTHAAGGAGATVMTMTTALVHSAADPKFTTKIDDSMTVEFLGVSKFPSTDESWYTIAGEPTDPPVIPNQRGKVRWTTQPEHRIMIHIAKPAGAVANLFLTNGHMVSTSAHRDTDTAAGVDDLYIDTAFALHHVQETLHLRMGLATEDWQTVATQQALDREAALDCGDLGMFQFSPAVNDGDGNATVEIQRQEFEEPLQFVAFDENGKEIECHNVDNSGDGTSCTTTLTYDVPVEKIKKVAVQVRRFSKIVEVDNISLVPGQATEPKITVTDK